MGQGPSAPAAPQGVSEERESSPSPPSPRAPPSDDDEMNGINGSSPGSSSTPPPTSSAPRAMENDLGTLPSSEMDTDQNIDPSFPSPSPSLHTHHDPPTYAAAYGLTPPPLPNGSSSRSNRNPNRTSTLAAPPKSAPRATTRVRTTQAPVELLSGSSASPPVPGAEDPHKPVSVIASRKRARSSMGNQDRDRDRDHRAGRGGAEHDVLGSSSAYSSTSRSEAQRERVPGRSDSVTSERQASKVAKTDRWDNPTSRRYSTTTTGSASGSSVSDVHVTAEASRAVIANTNTAPSTEQDDEKEEGEISDEEEQRPTAREREREQEQGKPQHATDAQLVERRFSVTNRQQQQQRTGMITNRRDRGQKPASLDEFDDDVRKVTSNGLSNRIGSSGRQPMITKRRSLTGEAGIRDRNEGERGTSETEPNPIRGIAQPAGRDASVGTSADGTIGSVRDDETRGQKKKRERGTEPNRSTQVVEGVSARGRDVRDGSAGSTSTKGHVAISAKAPSFIRQRSPPPNALETNDSRRAQPPQDAVLQRSTAKSATRQDSRKPQSDQAANPSTSPTTATKPAQLLDRLSSHSPHARFLPPPSPNIDISQALDWSGGLFHNTRTPEVLPQMEDTTTVDSANSAAHNESESMADSASTVHATEHLDRMELDGPMDRFSLNSSGSGMPTPRAVKREVDTVTPSVSVADEALDRRGLKALVHLVLELTAQNVSQASLLECGVPPEYYARILQSRMSQLRRTHGRDVAESQPIEAHARETATDTYVTMESDDEAVPMELDDPDEEDASILRRESPRPPALINNRSPHFPRTSPAASSAGLFPLPPKPTFFGAASPPGNKPPTKSPSPHFAHQMLRSPLSRDAEQMVGISVEQPLDAGMGLALDTGNASASPVSPISHPVEALAQATATPDSESSAAHGPSPVLSDLRARLLADKLRKKKAQKETTPQMSRVPSEDGEVVEIAALDGTPLHEVPLDVDMEAKPTSTFNEISFEPIIDQGHTGQNQAPLSPTPGYEFQPRPSGPRASKRMTAADFADAPPSAIQSASLFRPRRKGPLAPNPPRRLVIDVSNDSDESSEEETMEEQVDAPPEQEDIQSRLNHDADLRLQLERKMRDLAESKAKLAAFQAKKARLRAGFRDGATSAAGGASPIPDGTPSPVIGNAIPTSAQLTARVSRLVSGTSPAEALDLLESMTQDLDDQAAAQNDMDHSLETGDDIDPPLVIVEDMDMDDKINHSPASVDAPSTSRSSLASPIPVFEDSNRATRGKPARTKKKLTKAEKKAEGKAERKAEISKRKSKKEGRESEDPSADVASLATLPRPSGSNEGQITGQVARQTVAFVQYDAITPKIPASVVYARSALSQTASSGGARRGCAHDSYPLAFDDDQLLGITYTRLGLDNKVTGDRDAAGPFLCASQDEADGLCRDRLCVALHRDRDMEASDDDLLTLLKLYLPPTNPYFERLAREISSGEPYRRSTGERPEHGWLHLDVSARIDQAEARRETVRTWTHRLAAALRGALPAEILREEKRSLAKKPRSAKKAPPIDEGVKKSKVKESK